MSKKALIGIHSGTTFEEDVWIPTTCESCNRGPDLLRVHRVNGVVVNVEGNIEGQGFEQLARNQGRLCPKPYGLIQKLYNPYRLKTPLKRTNPEKGPGVDPKWVEISWDEALTTIAEKLKRIRAEDTRKLAVGGGGVQVTRSLKGTWDTFFRAFGAVQVLTGGGSIRCDMAEHIFGNLIHGAWHCEPDLSHCSYVLVLGRNPAASGGVAENINYLDAQARGMKMVVVDPVFTHTAAKADEWLPIRPGTDSAFLLALINVIIHEIGVYDAPFLKHMTNSPYLVDSQGYFVRDKATGKVLIWDPGDGKAKAHDDATVKDFALEGTYSVNRVEAKPAFQVLKEHVKQYTPEWASSVTDISAGTIRRIAREWVDHARIGSSIKLDGVTLPYRPVATKIGRGITGAMRSYQCILANHILAALVGAIEVVGGHGGGYAEPARRERGIVPGPDGMLELSTYPFTWPPISWGSTETLVPYSKQHGRLQHLSWLNIVHAPKNLPSPVPVEAYIRWRCNPLLSIGDPGIVREALRKIPFIVSIAYVMDEVSELADIVLPDHTDLERFELSTGNNKANARKFNMIALRQPVVEPLYNTRDIADILTELANRIGMLEQYNEAVNNGLGLTDPYKLEPNRKYTWIEIVDRQCKSVTGGVHDLEWFKKNGAILKPVTAEQQYDVCLEMTTKKLRYPIPYMEHVKRTGEELARNLAGVGIDWWPTSEYVALPAYFPPILEDVSPEYDFYITVARSIQFGWGSNVDLPWMIEVAEHSPGQMDILMNAKAAAARGIKEGDEIWVESEVGKVKRKVKLCQGIRPDTLLITGQFGQWAAPIAKDTGRVTQATLTPIRHSWTDPVVGCMQGNVVKAKVYKA